ncbi:hypothetical protein HGRIS_011044 [Hohenbuehelia grisea]|uniref:NAD(P)-binding protein n=1 Tax=Hohenbuehelia grisea TaxID=104357 RepID=A0ABR3IZG2_9AGAR
MQSIIDSITLSTGIQESEGADLKNMTVLVTGGTGGIGFEVARAFAASRARVLVLSRKSENGEEAVSKIKESIQGPVDIKFISCDLGNLAEVKQVADKIHAEEKALDIFVADAGVGVNKFDVSYDGIDRHFAVNHLGHFLLINRLMPLMYRTSRFPPLGAARPRAPRIVSISSELHRMAPNSSTFASEEEVVGTEDNQSATMSAVGLYARSKLANLLFTRYFVNNVIKKNGYNMMALATHPGAVHTGQQAQFKEAYGTILGTMLEAVTIPFMRNPEQGSASTVWAAVSPAVDGSDGKSESEKWQGAYVTDPGVKSVPSGMALDDEIAENLWRLSEELVAEKLGADALLDWEQKEVV